MQVNATIRVNNRPLPQAYVAHLVMGVESTFYMTDADGRIRSDQHDLGIDSFTGNADIRIFCQNPIARVVDGGLANIPVHQDASIVDNAVVTLNTGAEQRDHYDLLDRAWRAYRMVFRPLSFFQDLTHPDFPLGRGADLHVSKDRPKRIDISYPDNFPSPLAFVEPKRFVDEFPLMHIKSHEIDGRLFGETDADSPDVPQRPTLVPGELAHALHFSHLSTDQRGRAQDKYLEFMTSDLVAGGDARHSFAQRTTAVVAFIEALDHYGHRFSEFLRARQGNVDTFPHIEAVTPAIQREFVVAEWSGLTRNQLLIRLGAADSGKFPPPRPPSRPANPILRVMQPGLTDRLMRAPRVRGGDCEGAVYGAIFVDFALSVGLDFAASSYFRANALTFGEYRTYIGDHHPQHLAALERAAAFWGL